MTGFVCKNCNYKVEGKKPDRCPWCEAKGSMREEQSADEILKEFGG